MTRAFATRSLLVAALLGLGVTAAACGGAPGASYAPAGTVNSTYHGPVAAVVKLQYRNFLPHAVTIHTGQTVEWEWDDYPYPHNVTFSGFASPTQASGTYYHTFTSPGTYWYRSTTRGNMTGEVVVLP